MKLMDINDLAHYLGTKPGSIYSARHKIKVGLLPANSLPTPVPGGLLRWHPTVVDRWAGVAADECAAPDTEYVVPSMAPTKKRGRPRKAVRLESLS